MLAFFKWLSEALTQKPAPEELTRCLKAAAADNATEDFKRLIRAAYEYLEKDESLRTTLLTTLVAQYALESGWGRSSLANVQNNFGGMKWRKEMEGYATPVTYRAHDGEEQYCSFQSPPSFLVGYFRFLDRSPYEGWREASNRSAWAFRNHISETWAPDQSYQKKWEKIIARINKVDQ